MEKKELIKKEDISRELEMNLDEMDALFSEETLDIMRMGKIVGGIGETTLNSTPACATLNFTPACGPNVNVPCSKKSCPTNLACPININCPCF